MAQAPYVHPSSVVDEGAVIGAGSKIWFFCHVQSGARLGERCILGQNVNIDRDVVIGNGVKIQNNVSVYKGVIVEDDAFLGPSCVFTNVVNPRSHIERKTEFRRTVVGRGATVGANATVVCGHDLGPYCMVAAGAVVTREVPAFALVAGVPARLMGWVCRCGERLRFEGEAASCAGCGDRYRQLAAERIELLGATGTAGAPGTAAPDS
jgi:UDP-2-acetamido-3-amino-2,3-dideoxy-glucuronate N-acetyltransferase